MQGQEEERDRFRRFRPLGTKFRSKSKIHYHQSLMNLTQTDEVMPEVMPEVKRVEPKDGGIGRRMPKFFRWGGVKKNVPDQSVKTTDVLEVALLNSALTDKGFIGNLGIGQYIAADDSAFLSCETTDDNLVQHRAGHSKSMVNLSSIAPWTTQFTSDPVQTYSQRRLSVTDSDKDSCSTSSNGDPYGTSPTLRTHLSVADTRGHGTKRNLSTPDVIKILFYSHLSLDGDIMGTDTLTNAGQSPESRKGLDTTPCDMFLPAWFITGQTRLATDTTYSVYRTSDYMGDLRHSIHWLEHQLHKLKRNYSHRQRSPSAPRFAADLRARRQVADGALLSVPSYSPGMSRKMAAEMSMDEEATPTSAVRSSRVELKSMLRMFTDAARMVASIVNTTENQSPSVNVDKFNAWILRSIPISISLMDFNSRLLLPDLAKSSISGSHTVADVSKIIAEEVVQLYKIPQGSPDADNRLDLDRFTARLLMLTSSQLLITSDQTRHRNHTFATRFQSILSLQHVWCGRAVLDESDISLDPSTILSLRAFRSVASVPDSANSWKDSEPQTPVGQEVLGISATPRTDVFLIGCPPNENWLVRFADNTISDRWHDYLNDAITYNQRVLEGRSLYLKIMNQVTNNQVVYKYHKVFLTTTVSELQEKAVESMNINPKLRTQLFVRHNVSGNEQKEIPLIGYESPFLIAISLTYHVCDQSTAKSVRTPSPSRSLPNSPQKSNKTAEMFDFARRSEDLGDEMRGTGTCLEDLLQNLPAKDPVIPRDQVKVEFILRAGDRTMRKGKKNRLSGGLKASELKKSASQLTTVRAQKNKNQLREKTKSTLFLPIGSTPPSPQSGQILRGARSTGCLNSSGEQWEIFGRVPEELWPDAVLPQSVVNLFVILYYTGAQVEGIFRRTAVVSQVELMRIKVDENSEPITSDICPPMVAAGVLKKFFGEIPGHLLGDNNWDKWIAVTQISSVEERVSQMEGLIKKLPKVNQTLLTILIHLLAHIRDHESTNRMSAWALGTVWGPNLIQRPDSLLTPEDAKLSCQVVVCLLETPFITRLLFDTATQLHRELTRHYHTVWETIHAVDSSDGQLSSALQPSLRQQSVGEANGSHEEHSRASSVQSDFSSTEDKNARRQTVHHSQSSLQSTTTSSSAESQNASPQLTGSSRIQQSSPYPSDRRRGGHYLTRRKIIPHSEPTLPDLPVPPIMGDQSCPETSGRTRPDERRLIKQSSLPNNSNINAARSTTESAPPVPPRAHHSVGGDLRKSEIKHKTDIEVAQSAISPPVPPKAKPRTRGPLRATRTIGEQEFDRLSEAVVSYLGAQQPQPDSLNRPTGRPTRSSFSAILPVTHRLDRSLRTQSHNDESDTAPITIWDTQATTVRLSREKVRLLPATPPVTHRFRDRRHASTDRFSFPAVSNSNIVTAFRSPSTTNIHFQTLAELPKTETQSVCNLYRSVETDPSGSLGKPVNGNPSDKMQLFSTEVRVRNQPRRLERDKRVTVQGHPDFKNWFHPGMYDQPESGTRGVLVNMPIATRRRVQSIDRFAVLRRGSKRPGHTESQPLDEATIFHIDDIAGITRETDHNVDQDSTHGPPSVRRMSSHASTVSSESNTLISNSTEKIN
ncbi:hypothetical protein EG68_02312 [Paragonimus skrjabini miyazakii]|uniref:Rho-GAP domain-containing protein n=1 Tax=Paragonimus skrjabini miyazakii TaxID=59628 RepID=A0A8S9Z9P4_9TREM|nr:hypothetical protein EG68_02312 [Paragonimus skrjabini miyazakii]